MKRYFGSMVVWFVCVACGVSSVAEAAQVTYAFVSTVATISPAALGFPASLAGVNVGDPIFGTISYDAATPSSTNPVGSGIYGAATYYEIGSATFSFNVGGVVFDVWEPTLSAFVWNDYPTDGTVNYDGLLFLNRTLVGNPQFEFGELLLPTSTFSDTSLPAGDLPGVYGLRLRQAGGGPDWVDSAYSPLTLVPEPSAVILAALGAAGLLVGWRQRRI